MRCGLGVQLWRDGSFYEGAFLLNKPHGRGILIHAQHNYTGSGEGCDVYEGDWVDGKAHGYGEYCNASGTTYKGGWVADRQHGEGLETWPDGSYY